MDDAIRAADCAVLGELYAAMVASGHGRTVFVAGDDETGRSALLRSCAGAVERARPRPVVIGGWFENGVYVPWERDVEAASGAVAKLERALSVSEAVVSLADGIVPAAITGLLGQILARSKAALDLTANLLAGADDRAQPPVLRTALRRLCRDGPVVCIIDGDADGLLADLAGLFARRIARGLPLLLVVAVDGPEHLGAHEEGEPETLTVARQLAAHDVDVATWHWLAPLAASDVECWIGPTESGVSEMLLQITGGNAGYTAALWRDWVRSGVVEDVTLGRWRLADGREPIIDDVSDLLDDRLRRVTRGDLNATARAENVLAVAALEGRRFTAPAIADALGRDRDDTIDFLDEHLSLDDEHPDGFVVEDGFLHVRDERGQRSLAMYRFARGLDWLTLRHHGLSEAEQQHRGRRLADALHTLYGGEAHRVAPTLVRLYASAGNHDRARHYQRMADTGIDREVVLWRARNVLADDDPVDRAERRRASQLLIAAGYALFHGGPFADGLRFARAAHQFADLPADRATAAYVAGNHLMHLGDYRQAREQLLSAQQLRRELGDRSGQADARHGLATIDSLQGDYERAREQYTAVLQLRRELGDRSGQADARHGLATIDSLQGDYERAREQYTAVLQLRRELGDRSGQADARHWLATIDRLQGDYERAREQYTAVLQLRRELGDRRGQADARHGLATIDSLQGDYERAREQYTAVLQLRRELGDRRGQADARHGLATIDRLQGDYERAREQYTAVRQLRRELGDRSGQADARHGLATIDSLQGDYERAREQYTAVLQLRRELGDRRGQADARHGLATIDRLQGDYERAREQYTAVLQLRRELGDRSGQADARHGLATIDRLQGDYERAREQYTAVLQLRRELGDRRGQADIQRRLAEMASSP